MNSFLGFLIGVSVGLFFGFGLCVIVVSRNVQEKRELQIPQIEDDDKLPHDIFAFTYEECPKCGCWNLETRYAKKTDTYESPTCELCKTCGFHAHTWFGGEPEILNAGHNG